MAEKRIIGGIDAIILALKASGGYKYRAMVQLQDGQEFDSFLAMAEARMHWMAHAIQVAEMMLKELPPSGHHNRWDEYIERLGPPEKVLTFLGRRG